MRERIEILGVGIDNVSLREATELLLDWCVGGEKKFVVTPNPEILLKCQEDKGYLKLVDSADLKTADGAGLLWAAKYLKGDGFLLLSLVKFLFNKQSPFRERVTGTDLLGEVVRSAGVGVKVFLLGAGEGVAERAKINLYNKYKNECVVGVSDASPGDKGVLERVDESGANILFVAYGAPKQEKWIKENLKKLKNVKVAIGVGGAFDFYAGKAKRAPEWMRKLGLEWLFRLIKEPKRIKRIWNAVAVFPWVVWKRK